VSVDILSDNILFVIHVTNPMSLIVAFNPCPGNGGGAVFLPPV